MKKFVIISAILAILITVFIGNMVGVFAGEEEDSRIRITVDRLPPYGSGPDSWGVISGRVYGADPRKHCVIVYAGTDHWYIQPYRNNYYTRIESDGTWRTGTHLGYEYAILVTEKTYKATADIDSLPPPGGKILAVLKMKAQ